MSAIKISPLMAMEVLSVKNTQFKPALNLIHRDHSSAQSLTAGIHFKDSKYTFGIPN